MRLALSIRIINVGKAEMKNNTFSVEVNEGDVALNMEGVFSGEDLTLIVQGGTRPHIGSVSIAEYRESLKGDGAASATVSTINLLGHKDDIVGNKIAYETAKAMGKTCVVTCGIHFDGVTAPEIENIRILSDKLCQKAIIEIIHMQNDDANLRGD